MGVHTSVLQEILMIDRCKGMNLSHLESLPNVKFYRYDLYSDQVSDHFALTCGHFALTCGHFLGRDKMPIVN
eukprot:8458220-Pyramimonas_sp.AAC.1